MRGGTAWVGRWVALAMSAASTASAEDGALQWSDRDGRLAVIVRADPDALLGALGHDHVIVATGWRASVLWPEGTEACQVDVRVPVDGLVVDPPGARPFAGLDGRAASESDSARIVENLRGPEQLDSLRHPEIRFLGTRCVEGPAGRVEGVLTLLGASRPAYIPAEITRTLGGLRARGGFTFRGSDFGLAPYVAFGGALRNQDEITLLLDIGS